MKRLMYVLAAGMFLFTACSEGEMNDLQSQDEHELSLLYKKIIDLSNSETCTDEQEWKFTAIGSKACGGPTGYIPYSLKLDTAEFLDLVKQYTDGQKEYNIKYNIVSDCKMEMPPQTVQCREGKAELVYINMFP